MENKISWRFSKNSEWDKFERIVFSLEKRRFDGNIAAFKHKSLRGGWYFDQERK